MQVSGRPPTKSLLALLEIPAEVVLLSFPMASVTSTIRPLISCLGASNILDWALGWEQIKNAYPLEMPDKLMSTRLLIINDKAAVDRSETLKIVPEMVCGSVLGNASDKKPDDTTILHIGTRSIIENVWILL